MVSPSTDRRYGVAPNLAYKAPCRLATTANLPYMNGLLTIDGVVTVSGDRVLVKDQSDATKNGVWVADSGDWTRDVDFNGNRDIVKGTMVHVTSGATNARSWWQVSSDNPITIGTSQIGFIAGTVGTQSITYQTATAGQTSFTVPSFSAANLITIYVNGLLMSYGTDYTVTVSTTVTFTTGLTLGDEVVFIILNSVGSLEPADASLVNYTQGGSGAITRTVQQRLRDRIDASDFATYGDGTTDNYTGLTNAIAAAAGGTLRIKAGTYRINFTTTTCFIPGADTVIEGDGRDNTELVFVPSSTSNRNFFGNTNGNLTLRNIKITVVSPAGGSVMFVAAAASGLTIDGCLFDGAMTNSGASLSHTAYGINYPDATTAKDINVINSAFCHFAYPQMKSNTSTAVNARIVWQNCDFYENYNEDCMFNSPMGTMEDVAVLNCRFRDGKGYDASISSQLHCSFASVTNVRVIGNSFTGKVGTSTGHAIHFEDACYGSVVANNYLYVEGYGIEINGDGTSKPKNLLITNNIIKKAGTAKDPVKNLYGVCLVFDGSFNNPAEDVKVISNTITDYYVGIYSTAMTGDIVHIKDNHIKGCGTGISVRSGELVIDGNIVDTCDVGVKADTNPSSAADSSLYNNITFIDCTTNCDATEAPIGLLNPTFVFAPFSSTPSGSVYLQCTQATTSDRFRGVIDIQEINNSAAKYSYFTNDCRWDGSSFSTSTASALALQPGAINTQAARNSSALCVQVYDGSTAGTSDVRVQARFNGMIVLS